MTVEAAKALAEAGPWAVVLFIIAVGAIVAYRFAIALAKLHLEADAEDRRQRDDNYLLARDCNDGLTRLAKVEEDRERREAARAKAARSRKDDP